MRFGRISPARRRSIATWPSTATTTSLRGDLRLRRRAGEQDRLAHRLAQRRDPQVVLELGERLREGLGDGAGAVDGPAGHAADLGRDRARLQQPQRAVVVDRPLDVLRAAEDRGDRARRAPTRRRRSASASCGPSLAVELEDLAVAARARSGSRRPRRSRAARGRRAPRRRRGGRCARSTGSMPNRTPPKAGSISGWTSTAIGWSGAPARVPGGEHRLDRGDERVEVRGCR